MLWGRANRQAEYKICQAHKKEFIPILRVYNWYKIRENTGMPSKIAGQARYITQIPLFPFLKLIWF